MKIYLSLALLNLMLLTLSLPLQGNNSGEYKQVQLEGLKVTMVLQKRTPKIQQADWPAEPISLESQSVSVKGKTIHELLRENHIFADVEAFSVVYALNPSIKKLTSLDVPQVRIPKVKGGPGLQAILANGFVVLLTVDKELKDEFNQRVSKLNELSQMVSDLGTDKFTDVSARTATIDSLINTAERLRRMNMRITERFGHTIPTETLSQLNAEVGLLNKILCSGVLPGERISSSEQELIVSIEKDVRVKSRAFKEVATGAPPDRWPEVKVVVKTLRQGQEISHLRIYYAPPALKNQPEEIRSFGTLSSPSSKQLFEAEYCFWAARDPDKTAVTNEQCQEIFGQGQIEVQLTIIR